MYSLLLVGDCCVLTVELVFELFTVFYVISEFNLSLFDKVPAFPGVPVADYSYSIIVLIVFMFDPVFVEVGIVLLLLEVVAALVLPLIVLAIGIPKTFLF